MTDLREVGDISTGELLDGRYRLEERIGEGGSARVYRAEDTHLDRTIAVKLLRGPVDGPAVLERARAETRVLASLNHHSIVTVFDARISDLDGSYIAMEYVAGITLRDLISKGPVDERDVARIAVDVAEGLHVAHSAGIVHRDVKPSNVLLGPSPLPGPTWHAKLADFGIAFLLDTTRVTMPGLVMGTAAYIAPEQAQGAPPAPPSDVYSFGLMLIEALTGTRPYADAEGIGALTARLISPPAIPQTLDPTWQGLLRGMTATRPDDRPTALEVAMVASKLAAASADTSTVDHPTEAVVVATQPTIVLPAAAAMILGASGAAVETGTGASSAMRAGAGVTPAPGHETATPPSGTVLPVEPSAPTDIDPAAQTASRRRRRNIALLVIASVIAIALAAGVWAMALAAATPGPEPTTPAVVPSVVPTEPPTEEAPPPAVNDNGGEDESGPSNGNGGNGNGGNGNGGNGGNGGGGNGNGNGGGNQGGGNGSRGNGGGND